MKVYTEKDFRTQIIMNGDVVAGVTDDERKLANRLVNILNEYK